MEGCPKQTPLSSPQPLDLNVRGWEMRVQPQPLCSQWAPVKAGRALLEAAFLCLHCIPPPCTPFHSEIHQITAALLPHRIKAVRHLQGEKWDSKYEFTQQWEHKAIGRGTVNDKSGQPPAFAAVLCCSKALGKATASLQSTWNKLALLHSCVGLCMLQLQNSK